LENQKKKVRILKERPSPEERKYVSPVIEDKISQIKANITDPNTAKLFENSFPNTLDTTVSSFKVDSKGQPDSYVITGIV
jgi:meiotically up-regulated gene 157 (Mug157) protein